MKTHNRLNSSIPRVLHFLKVPGWAAGMGLISMAATLTGSASAAENSMFTNYTQKVAGSTVTFEMLAIPGGTIAIGSPENESGRETAELALAKVTVKPFWMGKLEVGWEEYLPYVFIEAKEIERFTNKLEGKVDKDGVSHPTNPYGSVYRGRGEKGHPAMGMGLPAAREYCRWLSKKTGAHYRLPTEAEWEYACRAGAATAYFWGDDPAQAKDYAWFTNNSAAGEFETTTQARGKLKPNKFGLHDVVGNIAEWCDNGGSEAAHVVRGGAFCEPAARLRCASRMIETEEWNELDPQSPQSIWWLASADFVGFRVVRSLDEEPAEAAKAASPAATESKAGSASTAPGAGAGPSFEAKALYGQYCAGCHGPDGKGQTALGRKKKARDYTDSAVKASLKDESMVKALKEGLTVNGDHVMMSYAEKLTGDQILVLAQYMKKF